MTYAEKVYQTVGKRKFFKQFWHRVPVLEQLYQFDRENSHLSHYKGWNFWINSRIRGKNHSNSKSSFGNSYSNVMFDPWVVSESHLRWKTWLTARNSTFYVFLEVFSPPSISPFPWMCFFWGRILYLATVMSSRPVWILYGVRRALILLKMEIDWWIFLL